MPKYVVLFGLAGDALARFIDNPEDRRAPVSQLAEAVGGRLEAYYWMFGQYDGLAIFECPDAAAAATVALTAAGSGAFRHFETHELIAAKDLVGILQRAQSMRPSYRPPGQTSG